MLGWFRALLPREDKFFDLFEKQSRILVAGAPRAVSRLFAGASPTPSSSPWVITMPATAVIAAVVYALTSLVG